MITYLRTDSGDSGFRQLVTRLDAHLAVINGNEHDFFSQFNQIQPIKHVVVACRNGVPVGCGAMKAYAPGTMEIKRMFVVPEQRGQGIASGILQELEAWSLSLQYPRCVLETALALQEAIGLYRKSGYSTIPNYGQYEHVDSSICFEKILGGAM